MKTVFMIVDEKGRFDSVYVPMRNGKNSRDLPLNWDTAKDAQAHLDEQTHGEAKRKKIIQLSEGPEMVK
jgi:hypothetical protein